jgi:hypothetical protein
MNLQQLVEQILLGRKVIVDRPGLDTGFRRNFPHRHRGVARAREQFERCIAQLLRCLSPR